MNKGLIEKKDIELGQIKMADEVIEIIAGLAATEVPGVTGMSGGIADGIAEVLGRKNLTKGVKVTVGEKEVIINLNIVVEYGVNISEVAAVVKTNVAKAIKSMTGMIVSEVNINVQGLTFKDELSKEEVPRVK
ncbi:MAG: Asp23/Gls24 family envelope stress response protein [Bacillota bacterium]